MNKEIWSKNIAAFRRRFPALSELLSDEISRFDAALSDAGADAAQSLFPFWEVSPAKNGSPAAKEGALRLHSAYNPEREAECGLLAAADFVRPVKSVAIFGFGLGYSAVQAARLFPQKPLLIIEPDAARFFAALLFLDWTDVFSCPDVAVAVSCTVEQAAALINRHPVSESVVFHVRAQTEHNRRYFDALLAVVSRNAQKEETNRATFKRFARLWLRNSILNAEAAALSDGVECYRGKAKGIPFALLAAGPSLEQIIPSLLEIKRRAVVVCVDTALRQCLRAGVEPDFIVLTDPQYWAYRHIAGLSSPSSILIAEAAVHPAVFRFPCRKVACCSSQLPVGRFFEKSCGEKGDLGSGGSVASSAWNFAELAGAEEIFVAGLDLSFPERKTHIRGSQFEEEAHIKATRLHTAETDGAPALLSGGIMRGLDYRGRPVLTDRRMQLFAWWFESRLAACPSVRTYTLSDRALAIPGVAPARLSALLSMPEACEKKALFLGSGDNPCDGEKKAARARRFAEASSMLSRCMADCIEKTDNALLLCRTILDSGADSKESYGEAERRLESAAEGIQDCAAKDIISLLLRGWTLPLDGGGRAEHPAVLWQKVFSEARSLMELFVRKPPLH